MIRQKAKKIIVSAFGSGYSARDGINFAVSCPECDPTKSKKKLSVRLDDFRYHCWVCGIKGQNIWSYISRKFPGVQIDPILFKKKSQKDLDEEVVREVEIPKNCMPVFRKNSDPYIKSVRNYLER